MARVYRFHNFVALSVAGSTVYLPASAARDLAKQLSDAARSVENGGFASHTLPAFEPVAAYTDLNTDAHHVADLAALDQIKATQKGRETFRASYRDKAGKWRTVNGAYGPLNYITARYALEAAAYMKGKE